MRTEPAKAGRQPTGDGPVSMTWRTRLRQWRTWLPFVVKPLRRGVLLFVVVLVIEYLVVPELVGASKDLSLLGGVNGAWLAAGLVTEGLSLFCYGLLTQAVLSPAGPDDPPRPGLSRLFRIDLAAAAIAHVIPAGTLGSAGIGYRLFTAEGIKGNDAAVMMATKGLGSTVVLNVLLWLSLVVSIPLAGFHPIYVTVAIISAVLLLAIAALGFGITRGAGRASRILHSVGDRIPGLVDDIQRRSPASPHGLTTADGSGSPRHDLMAYRLTPLSINDTRALYAAPAATARPTVITTVSGRLVHAALQNGGDHGASRPGRRPRRQTKAAMPVMARPTISVLISRVPS